MDCGFDNITTDFVQIYLFVYQYYQNDLDFLSCSIFGKFATSYSVSDSYNVIVHYAAATPYYRRMGGNILVFSHRFFSSLLFI